MKEQMNANVRTWAVMAPRAARLLVVLSSTTLPACSEAVPEREAAQHAPSKTQSHADALVFGEQRGDSASPRAVMLSWVDQKDDQVGLEFLEFEARNTKPVPIVVRVELSALDQERGTLTRELEQRQIPAGATLSLQASLSAMPVQTSGSATSVTVTATYEAAASILGDEEQTITVQTATEPRLVTFDDSFSQAIVRTLESQIEYDTQRTNEAGESRGMRRLQSGERFAEAQVQNVVATLVRETGPSEASPNTEPAPSTEPSPGTEVQR